MDLETCIVLFYVVQQMVISSLSNFPVLLILIWIYYCCRRFDEVIISAPLPVNIFKYCIFRNLLNFAEHAHFILKRNYFDKKTALKYFLRISA